MAKITEILSIMRELAPEDRTEQDDFEDNVGLILGTEKGETEDVLLCLDCTENAVSEAKAIGAKLIISHHPAIFLPIKRITDSDPTGRMLLAAARAGISVYSAHTNLDFCEGGLNDYAAELIGMDKTQPMETPDGIAVGRVGEIRECSLKELSVHCSQAFNDHHVRFVGRGDEKIKRVAVINGGAGSINYVKRAMERGADCYVTADVPHHVALYAAQSGFPLVIMQHYAMEAVYLKRLQTRLETAAAAMGLGVRFKVSESEYNPSQQEVL